MRVTVAGYKMRCTAASTETLRTFYQRADCVGMICQSKIVIAAEGEVWFSIDRDFHALRGVQRLSPPVQVLLPAALQSRRKITHQ